MVDKSKLKDQAKTDLLLHKKEVSLRNSRSHIADLDGVPSSEENLVEGTPEPKHWKRQKLTQRSYFRGYSGL
jgi:hypothetical protein